MKNVRIKNLGIFLLHITYRRYYGIFLDPIYACNLKCRMCYFSDEERRKTLQRGKFEPEDLSKLAHAFFAQAIKLQIGCGAEPSLFKYNNELIRLAKEKKVPYISLTTNANLLKKEDWKELLAAGLDEATLSLHGVTRESYEFFMTGGSYDAFCNSLQALTDLKKDYPHFNIRINYTVNKDNLEELKYFFDFFGKYALDVLQIRPIQKLADHTAYTDFSWDQIIDKYEEIIEKVKQECHVRNVICMAPNVSDLSKDENIDSTVRSSTYFYISPERLWKPDFDLNKDTFRTYAKRTGLASALFRAVFMGKKKMRMTKNSLNYEIN